MNDVELMQLSQLCDGELDNETLVQVLLDVVDSPEAKAVPQTEPQRMLCDLLRMRQATAGWRNRQSDERLESSENVPEPSTGVSRRRGSTKSANQVANARPGVAAYVSIIASCACLLLIGFVVGLQQNRNNGGSDAPVVSGAAKPSREVPTERRRQIAEVFAFHESVAGPLNWYAAGDDAEDLALAVGEQQSAPVGMLLRFTTQGEEPESREFVIVCRDRTSASIQLPGLKPGADPVQVRLTPRSDRDAVQLQYSVVLPGTPGATDAMGLAGRRAVGASLNDLGEFASDTQSIRVEAGAWLLEGVGA